MPTTTSHGGYAGFEGHIERTLSESTPWWPSRPRPPAQAPHVVIILVDDLGYADIGCYGSEIPTPNLDRLAAEGVRHSNFHVAPSCSPTRASLLTGLNPHAAGFGFPAQVDPGFPGYAMEFGPDVLTLPEVFGAQGYSTMMVGKWHLAREADGGPGGDRRSWPLPRGFDRFYGFIDGFTDYFAPHQLIDDNHPVSVEDYPEDYYLTDDLTNKAITMVREQQVAYPGRPFFLYVAHGAVHAPLQAKPEDVARHRDRYAVGWDEIRRRRFERQMELGLLPPGTALPARNWEPGNDVPPWDELDGELRQLYARYMAVYAAMVDCVDQNVGRLLDELDALGVGDDTMVLFLSDNGASREGGPCGTSNYLHGLHAGFGTDLSADLAVLDEIGGPHVYAHYPRGWAMASNTPFRLYKLCAHAGAHQVPLITMWRRAFSRPGSIRREYAHVTDILPTLLDLAGLERPEERRGIPVQPLAGASFAPALVDSTVVTEHGEQHYEAIGNRAYYREGWEVVSLHQPGRLFDDSEWELYHTTDDPTQTTDLSTEYRERVHELSVAWEEAAWANRVFPLADDIRLFVSLRPPSEDEFERPVRIRPGTPTLDRYRSGKLVQYRSFMITAAVELRTVDHGVLVSHGGQGGGYVFYVEDGMLVFGHRAFGKDTVLRGGPLRPGASDLVATVDARAGGWWSVELSVDGATLARLEDLATFQALLAPLHGIDVGIAGRSPVSWSLHERHGTFPWTGVLRYVEYRPGPVTSDAPSPIAQQMLKTHWD